MRPDLVLPFPTQPDLASTMDIQIPALAWQPAGPGRFHRTYFLGDHAVDVQVAEAPDALHFFHPPAPAAVTDRLHQLLRQAFPQQIADLTLGPNPTLRALQHRYQGTMIMWADPFEALVLTILSQNRTGEIVRAVYPKLAAHCGGISPQRLAAIAVADLATLIRSAGPYKAPRLAATASQVAAEGERQFTAHVVNAPAPQALAYLESFPGVAHKTAACVLVFSARTSATLPVDTHLFRVADRLGLARHNGRNPKTSRDALITTLLGYSPDLAPAHFLFLLVGRTTCGKSAPDCTACFLRPGCSYACGHAHAAPPASPHPQGEP